MRMPTRLTSCTYGELAGSSVLVMVACCVTCRQAALRSAGRHLRNVATLQRSMYGSTLGCVCCPCLIVCRLCPKPVQHNVMRCPADAAQQIAVLQLLLQITTALLMQLNICVSQLLLQLTTAYVMHPLPMSHSSVITWFVTHGTSWKVCSPMCSSIFWLTIMMA
jgi:hypothetical protein